MTDPNAPIDAYAQAPSDGFDIVMGPSFNEQFPSTQEWLLFADPIKDPASRALAELWLEKAQLAKGVPNRKDFAFEELVRFGPQLLIYKRDDNGKWMTTFCGNNIVDTLGFELTGRHLEDYGANPALDFWLNNMVYITEQSRVVREQYDLKFVDKEYLRCESVSLPLRAGTSSEPSSFFEIMHMEPAQTAK